MTTYTVEETPFMWSSQAGVSKVAPHRTPFEPQRFVCCASFQGEKDVYLKVTLKFAATKGKHACSFSHCNITEGILLSKPSMKLYSNLGLKI